MTSNKQIFDDLCKQYNLNVTTSSNWYRATPQDNKMVGGESLLSYSISTDKLYMAGNLLRDCDIILSFSIIEYSPILFKAIMKKYYNLIKEVKYYQIKKKLEDINEDFL